jgi:hypothetical protein
MATKKTGMAAGAAPIVEGEVIEVLQGVGLAHVRGSDGLVYGLRRHTPGIDWDTVREGQRVRCWVTLKFRRVLHADVLS